MSEGYLEKLQALVAERSTDYRQMGQLVSLANLAQYHLDREIVGLNNELTGVRKKLSKENARLKSELNKDDCLKLANDADRLLAENALLKAALKPVLEVGWVEKRYNYCSGTVPTKDLYQVVREAQRIYNGGAK